MKHTLLKHPLTLEQLKRQLMRNKAFREAYAEGDLEYQLIRKRLEKRLTQQQLAKKIGTTQSAIARFEAGNVNPSLSFLRKIARAVGATITVS